MAKFGNKLPKKFQFDLDKQKVTHWLKLTGITGSTQLLIQGIGLLSGIIIIRLLPTEHYALYTLANTMLGTMVVLADSGIGSGVTAESGKVWRDPKALGAVVNTGLDLRKKFAIGSLVIASPILIYLLHFHGAPLWMAFIIVLALIPAFISSLSSSIFIIPMKLNQDVIPAQRNAAAESVLRFASIFSSCYFPSHLWLFWPPAYQGFIPISGSRSSQHPTPIGLKNLIWKSAKE